MVLHPVVQTYPNNGQTNYGLEPGSRRHRISSCQTVLQVAQTKKQTAPGGGGGHRHSITIPHNFGGFGVPCAGFNFPNVYRKKINKYEIPSICCPLKQVTMLIPVSQEYRRYNYILECPVAPNRNSTKSY